MLAGCPAASAGGVPDGPQIAFIRSGEPLPGDELLSVDTVGERWRTLFRTPNSSGSFGSLSWSGDGTKLAFEMASGDFDAPPVSGVFTLPAGGGRPRMVRGTKGGHMPVFSPNDATIAFARVRFFGRGKDGPRYGGVSIWLVDANGGKARQLTPWRKGVGVLPASFSPDGSKLVAVRQRSVRSPEIVSVRVADGATKLLVENGIDPSYSPDGSAIAFVRLKTLRLRRRRGVPPEPVWGGDVFVTAADGSTGRRLTFTPSRLETGPNWDPSGERIVFVRLPAKQTFRAREGVGSSIIEVNTDGSCGHHLLFTYGIAYSEAVWQPGPGREAGRILC